jgi:DNA-directed RNA polymerase specialized sigma24 family protein
LTEPSPNRSTAHINNAADLPVTLWLRQLEHGDHLAAETLYEQFFNRLQQMARMRIPATISSEYDLAANAFHSVFLNVRKQKYGLNDGGDFWRLLLAVARTKDCQMHGDELRDKRNVGRMVGNSVFLQTSTETSEGVPDNLEALAGREPTPELAGEVSETCESLFAPLPDESSRKIAQLNLENHTANEIAAKLGCTRRTVQRKLLVIRRTWQHVSGIENDEAKTCHSLTRNRQ